MTRLRTKLAALSGSLCLHWCLLGCLLVAVTPIVVHFSFAKVSFNQFQIQWLDIKNGRGDFRKVSDLIKSSWLSGLSILTEKKPDFPETLEDVEALYRFVMSWVPPYAVVYPSEEFYYWKSRLKDGTPIMGNLRIADLFEKERMSFAVFESRPRELEPRAANILNRKSPGDLEVTIIDPFRLELSALGRRLTFKVVNEAYLPKPENLKLTKDEEYLGQILDESGVRLFFIYNRTLRAFYDVLNESALSEDLHDIGAGISIGRRTGFAFFHMPELDRKILVGVDSYNSLQNNFFDGPADQVPFRLKFRDQLHAAYPNTYLEGGIDEHGVYTKRPEWVRIAVAPFHQYVHIDDLLKELSMRKCEATPLESRSTCLTREWWNTPRFRAFALTKAGRR